RLADPGSTGRSVEVPDEAAGRSACARRLRDGIRVGGAARARGRDPTRLADRVAAADRDHPALGQNLRRREARVDPADRVLLVVRVDLLLPARAAEAALLVRAALRRLSVRMTAA